MPHLCSEGRRGPVLGGFRLRLFKMGLLEGQVLRVGCVSQKICRNT